MAKKRKHRKSSSSFGDLGLSPVGKVALYGVAGLAGVGVFLWASGAFAAPVDPVPQPQEDPCGAAALQRAVANAAAGGATGAAAGGGVGAGAGAGIAIAPDLLRCGPKKFQQAKKELCSKADRVVKKLKAKGAKVPKAWSKLSCDEKIAWVAALGPFGVGAILAGTLVGKLATDAAAEVKRWGASALRTAGKFGDTAREAAKDVGDAFEDAGKKATDAASDAVKSVGKKTGLWGIEPTRFGFAGRGTQELCAAPVSVDVTVPRVNTTVQQWTRVRVPKVLGAI